MENVQKALLDQAGIIDFSSSKPEFTQNSDYSRSILHWIAPSEKDAAATALKKRLWETADQFRTKGP